MLAGIIGAGFISVRGHVPGYRSVPGVEVVALCDIKEGRARAAADELCIPRAYTDYREMLRRESLDLVSVCAPNALHARMAMDALEAGAHVLCEKPMALTYADACAMVETSRRTGRSLTVGFHTRYRPEMVAAKEVVQGGGLGGIYYARASMLRGRGIPGYGSWFTNKDLAGGGAMMDIGCHILDLALWLLDHPKPLTVSAMTYAEFGPKARGLGTWGADHHPPGARFDVDDLTTAFVRFEGGLSLVVDASWAIHGPGGHRVQLFGTEGGLEFNERFGRGELVHLFVQGEDGLSEKVVEYPEAEGTPYQREIGDWVRTIQEGKPPTVTAEQAAEVVQIVEGVYRSAENGVEVSLQ